MFRANHLEPGDFQRDFILLPIGYSYNAEWATAKKGDVIRFHGGESHRIVSVRMVKKRGGLAELLSLIRYGISFAGCVQRWRDNAKLEGHGPGAISEDECIFVVYEKETRD